MNFKCPKCGSETFLQQGYYEVNETININQSDKGIDIISLSLKVVDGSQEYLNEMRCTGCEEIYTITNTDGTDTVNKA